MSQETNNVVDIIDNGEIIAHGLAKFMETNDLELSDQNFSRACRHLMHALKGYDKLTTFTVINCLQTIFEYKEGVIEAMDRDGLSEESLMSIIITADKKTSNPNYRHPEIKPITYAKLIASRIKNMSVLKKILMMFVVFIAFALPILSYQKSSYIYDKTEIGESLAIELKDMVAQVVALEQKAGNKASASTVWTEVKSSDDVLKYGYKSSYHNFNMQQYNNAKLYLQNKIEKLEKTN